LPRVVLAFLVPLAFVVATGCNSGGPGVEENAGDGGESSVPVTENPEDSKEDSAPATFSP